MTWSWSFVWEIMPSLLGALVTSIFITVLASLIALVGGLLLAVAAAVGGPLARLAVRTFVEIVRGVPPLVVLYFGFFGLPGAGISLSAFHVGVLVLGVLTAAFCSEVYRGALISIPNGQREACLALSLPVSVTWTRILLPLAIRRSIPALANYVVIIFRETAVLFAIGVPVLLTRAQVIGSQTYRYLEPYTVVGVLYIVVNIPLIVLLQRYAGSRAPVSS
jgi:polar amino acid transport system permease protein